MIPWQMQAIIFIGIQGSGKTTFYKEYFFDSHLRISLDLLRTRHREKQFLETSLETRTRFVIDNTNPLVSDRERYIVPARRSGYSIIGYYFDVGLDTALRLNGLRSGKSRIPEQGIVAAYHKLEVPSCDEGFDTVYRVSIPHEYEFNLDILCSNGDNLRASTDGLPLINWS